MKKQTKNAIKKPVKKASKAALTKSPKPEPKAAVGLQASPTGCEEASVLSQEKYIPCNRPARHKMQNERDKKQVLRMCDFCADHNLRRGFKNIGPFPNAKDQPKQTTAEFVNKAGAKLVGADSAVSASDLEELNVQTPVSSPQRAELDVAVSKVADKMQELEQVEELAKALRSEIHHINNRVIPEIAASLGLGKGKFTTVSGIPFVIDDFINGSIPKDPDRRTAALSWLEENGAADIIKHQVSMAFGKHAAKEHDRVVKELKKLGVEFKDDLSVHAGTLASFARERMGRGEDVPFDLLGLFAGRMAKVTLPKKEEASGE